MSNITIDPLEQLIRASGENWLIDWFAPPDKALPHFRQVLERADQCAVQRFGQNGPRLTIEALRDEQQGNPHKVRALLQILPTIASPDMLVMALRIMRGMNIDSMHLEYEEEQSFRLRVRLKSMYDDKEIDEYETTDIHDAVVLRHFGILKMNDRPAFDGFYPLRVGD
ncbi:MAG TPA: hypothetical protein VH370_03630 [Humisphaera sp.]|jgi:hypothetical protein|nr:hypothetical protein [Humisphaera sp.]